MDKSIALALEYFVNKKPPTTNSGKQNCFMFLYIIVNRYFQLEINFLTDSFARAFCFKKCLILFPIKKKIPLNILFSHLCLGQLISILLLNVIICIHAGLSSRSFPLSKLHIRAWCLKMLTIPGMLRDPLSSRREKNAAGGGSVCPPQTKKITSQLNFMQPLLQTD